MRRVCTAECEDLRGVRALCRMAFQDRRKRRLDGLGRPSYVGDWRLVGVVVGLLAGVSVGMAAPLQLVEGQGSRFVIYCEADAPA